MAIALSRDALSYWLIYVVAAFFLSAAHNVLYFVLDIRTPVIHFLHFFNTFLVLLYHFFTYRPESSKSHFNLFKIVSEVAPSAFVQLLITLLSSRVHSQNRSGSLYLLRLFDFLVTITALKLSPKFIGVSQKGRALWSYTLPVAIAGSLSWLEFSHIEYDGLAIFLSPILSVCQGLHMVLLKKAYNNSPGLPLETFSLIYTALVSSLLFLPAIISYSSSSVSYDASWESIDYVMIGMSLIYMAVYKYSELWLLTQIDIRSYCVLEHSKYFLASCGQWFLQNMAHATIYAFCGKLLFVGSLLRYCIRLRQRTV